MNRWSCDFETTTDPEDCRVWAFGVCRVDDINDFKYSNSISGFFDFFDKHKNAIGYFQNLRFDAEFIINELFKRGYKWKQLEQKQKLRKQEFTTTIDGKNKFYALKIWLGADNTITLYDSFKIIPLSVKNIAKAYGLSELKGEIDYTKYRAVGHELDNEEIEYLRKDVQIVAQALNVMFEQDLTKMTLASNAMWDYKNTISKKLFGYWFPPPEMDAELRLSYKGAYTYANECYVNQVIDEGIVLDVNSLYPSVMRYKPLPYGVGKYFEGDYKYDKLYPLYIIFVTFEFDLKPGYLPILQIKNGYHGLFAPTVYQKTSGGTEVTLALTCIDWQMINEHYKVKNPTVHCGWKFMESNLMFADYIDKWTEIKVQATKDKNYGLRTVAKAMLNNLYGKFASNPIVDSKKPVYCDGKVKYERLPDDTRPPIYIAVASFITAYARQVTITGAQQNFDRFLYCDTDSLHLIGKDIPKELDIDDTKLGAWKHEGTFKRGKYLRAKSYIEELYASDDEISKFLEENPELEHLVNLSDKTITKITCAGMPVGCYKYVTFDNFTGGSIYAGKLQMQHTKGGMYLKEVDFTLKL